MAFEIQQKGKRHCVVCLDTGKVKSRHAERSKAVGDVIKRMKATGAEVNAATFKPKVKPV